MLDRLSGALRQVESALLVGLLGAMIGVAVYQVLARNLFGAGLTWGDPMVRVALLWVTMVGGMVASASDQHIRIDLVARFLSPAVARRVGRLTGAFTAAVCFGLAWFSVTLVLWDYRDGTPGFGPVPAWVCELVIPVGAAVMGLRYLVRSVALDRPAAETPP
ncbi:MAG: TRAP transporter small permease [Gammaproteobacteria bacterium]|nr:TRAP transporter small permease [Gammaproteobacteria bacterium]